MCVWLRDAQCDHRSLGIRLVDKVEYLQEVHRVGCTVCPRVLDLDSAPATEVEHTDPGADLGPDHPDQGLAVVTLGGGRDPVKTARGQKSVGRGQYQSVRLLNQLP